MKPGIPWSIKGIESDTREAAKAAARRSGMTLGQWLNGMIQEEAESQLETPKISKKSKKKQKSRSRKEKRQAAKKAARVDLQLADLAAQLNAMSDMGQATAVNRFVEYDNEPVADRALEAMIERIERGEEQTSQSFNAINSRLDGIDQKLTGTPEEVEEQSPEFKALEAALRNIVEHIETSEKRNREALGNMQDRMSDMSKKAEQAQNGAINQTAPAIAALDARVAELTARHDEIATSSQDETRSYLEERLAGIGEQIDAVRHSTDAMTKRAEASAVDAAKKQSMQVEQRVAGLIGEARNLMVQSAPSNDTLANISSEIESLNQRFDDIKAESASDHDVQSLKLAIEQLTNSVSAGTDNQPLAAMEQRLAELTHRLDEKPATDHIAPQFAELEQRIVGLDQQLAAALNQQDDSTAFSALESQINMVADRMSATEEKLGALTTIEQSISQLYSAIEENKAEVHTVAETAVNRMAQEVLQNAPASPVETGPSPELIALEEGLAAVRQNSQAAEQHNQETLEAVHETLEQIITKLADMETREAAAPVAQQPVVQQLVADQPTSGQPNPTEVPGSTDWQAAVQSHLQEAVLPPQDQPNSEPANIEPASDVSPAFNPGDVPQQVPTTEPIEMPGQSEFQQDIAGSASAGAGDPVTGPVFDKIPDAAPHLDAAQQPQPQPAPGAGEPPLDYIAQARLASQTAATQSSGSITKSAGFLTDKIMPGRDGDAGTGEGKAKKKSLFSLPFLTKKNTEADNDQPAVAPAAEGEPKSSRRKLIMAGLVLLIAAGAFAFNKVTSSSDNEPVPTANVQEKAAPPKIGTAKTPTPEKSNHTIVKTPQAKKLVKQISLTVPQNNIAATVTADQTGMPGPQAFVNKEQSRDPILSAPTDPITTASLPPAPAANHNIQSPLNIQTAPRTASQPPAPTPQAVTLPADQNPLPKELGTPELRQAAIKGDSSAQFVIATRYADGKTLPRDYAKAAEWYQKAASNGLAPAQYRLGTLFERGNGVPKDLNAARLWYERAAENGNVKAMHNLAVIYASAKGGQTDFVKAKKWFGKASSHGLKDSQYNLAVIFERGLAGARDQKQAYYWYSLAAARGDRDAGVKAHTLKNYLTPSDITTLQGRLAAWKPKPALRLGNYVAIKDTKWQVGAQAKAKPKLGPKPTLTGKKLILETQTLLSKMGFEIGKKDGVMGSRTANAIRLFQLQNGLQVNGMVTNSLLQQLQART